MSFSQNMLSRASLSYGFCYYLYLEQYSFISVMYLFLSVHLEIGGIIFFMLWGEDVKLQTKTIQNCLLLPQSIGTEHMGESFRGSLGHCKKRFWTSLSWHFQPLGECSKGKSSMRLAVLNIRLLCLEDPFTNLCYS